MQTQGENTTAFIGVTVRNAGSRCALGGSVRLTIQRAGRRLAVRGKPIAIPARGVLGPGRSSLFSAGWMNWCGTRTQIRLVARYAGAMSWTRFNVLPLCLDREQPSKLSR